ncbi:MAG: hypothetical protein JRI66_10715 [Deltaproteobacteria bacterium]|nr:hypothetical protein [Deltaproteobacteria bacterium]
MHNRLLAEEVLNLLDTMETKIREVMALIKRLEIRLERSRKEVRYGN